MRLMTALFLVFSFAMSSNATSAAIMVGKVDGLIREGQSSEGIFGENILFQEGTPVSIEFRYDTALFNKIPQEPGWWSYDRNSFSLKLTIGPSSYEFAKFNSTEFGRFYVQVQVDPVTDHYKIKYGDSELDSGQVFALSGFFTGDQFIQNDNLSWTFSSDSLQTFAMEWGIFNKINVDNYSGNYQSSSGFATITSLSIEVVNEPSSPALLTAALLGLLALRRSAASPRSQPHL